MPETLGKAYSKTFIFLLVTSTVFLLICIVSASFLNNTYLLTFGIIYMFMLSASWVLWNQQVEVEKNFLIAYIAGIASLFGLSIIFGIFTQRFQTIGMLRTVDTTAIQLSSSFWNLTPAQTWAFFMNLPGPVAEESFFRIFLWKALTPMLGRGKSIIAIAIAFGWFHFFAYGQDFITLMLAICVGLALGVIYMVWENELAVATSHLTYNIIILIQQITGVL